MPIRNCISLIGLTKEDFDEIGWNIICIVTADCYRKYTEKNILHKEVKKDPFVSQYGQEAIQTGRKTSGSYALMMLNNNVGTRSTNDHKSYYYRYQIDESSRTYQLKAKQEFGNAKEWKCHQDESGISLLLQRSGLFCGNRQYRQDDQAFHPGYKTDRVVKMILWISGSIKM